MVDSRSSGMHWFLESDCAVGVHAVSFCGWLCSAAVADEDFRDSDRPCPIN